MSLTFSDLFVSILHGVLHKVNICILQLCIDFEHVDISVTLDIFILQQHHPKSQSTINSLALFIMQISYPPIVLIVGETFPRFIAFPCPYQSLSSKHVTQKKDEAKANGDIKVDINV